MKSTYEKLIYLLRIEVLTKSGFTVNEFLKQEPKGVTLWRAAYFNINRWGKRSDILKTYRWMNKGNEKRRVLNDNFQGPRFLWKL